MWVGGGIRAICESMAMTLSHHVCSSPLQNVSTKFYRSLGSVLHLTNAKITNLFPQQPRHFADPGGLQHPPAESLSFLPSQFHTAVPARHSCRLWRPATTRSVMQRMFLFSSTGLGLPSCLLQLRPCPAFPAPQILKLPDCLHDVQEEEAAHGAATG